MVELLNPLVAKGKEIGSIIEEIVTVAVGQERTRYRLNKRPLLSRARNIHARKSSQVDEYILADVKPSTFELYIHYIFTGEIACESSTKQGTWDFVDQDIALVDFYLLVSDIGDQIAVHAVLRALLCDCEKHKVMPLAQKATVYALKEVGQDSPLYRLLLDMYAWSGRSGSLMGRVPNAFIIEALKVTLEKLEKGEDPRAGIKSVTCCDYHQLDDGVQCVSKKRKRDKADE